GRDLAVLVGIELGEGLLGEVFDGLGFFAADRRVVVLIVVLEFRREARVEILLGVGLPVLGADLALLAFFGVLQEGLQLVASDDFIVIGGLGQELEQVAAVGFQLLGVRATLGVGLCGCLQLGLGDL